MLTLDILDGNCFLHCGEAGFSKNFAFKGFPTSGIYHLMQKIVCLHTNNMEFAVVFDSPSFRKSVNSDYKKSRKIDNKILAQAEAIIPMLKRAGVNVLQVPEFEGDDLIANVIAANNDRDIFIHTCDYDIAMNIRGAVQNPDGSYKRGAVSVMGCRKDFPAINKESFTSIMRKECGMTVPYNLLGMQKLIFGCKSDEISGLGEYSQPVWEFFLAIWNKSYDSKGKVLIADKKIAEWFVGTCNGRFPESVVRTLAENCVLVFPRTLTDKEITDNDISITKFNNVSSSNLSDICRIFGLKKSYRMLNYGDVPEELTDRELEWILRAARNYKLNAPAIDAGIPSDYQVDYSGADEVVPPLDIDYTHGMNVGSF